MSPDRSNDYVIVTSSHGRPPAWTWEIQRRSKPLGVRVYGAGFKTEFAARLAGEKALKEFLDGLAEHQGNPVHSEAASAAADTPHCPRCHEPLQLVRTIPRVGANAALLVFNCASCEHVETRQQD